MRHRAPSEENGLEDDADKDDTIESEDGPEEETAMPKLIEIKQVKGWKPKAKEYEPEILQQKN